MSAAKWRPLSLGLYILEMVTWWRHQMETISALMAICEGNSSVSGEVPKQRPVTRSVVVFFDLRRIKRLNKQSWGWWFETLSRPLWRHCYHKLIHKGESAFGPAKRLPNKALEICMLSDSMIVVTTKPKCSFSPYALEYIHDEYTRLAYQTLTTVWNLDYVFHNPHSIALLIWTRYTMHVMH